LICTYLGANMYIMKAVTLTEFRKNLFRLVAEALETGEPIVINRKGRRLVIKGDAAPAVGEAQAERWRRFWAEPTPRGWEKVDLSLEALDQDREADWRWDKDPELER
jgi:hypothetical protein